MARATALPYSDGLGLTRTDLLEAIEIEVLTPSKPPSVSGARWSGKEEKVLRALAKKSEMDWQGRADALAKRDFGLRTARALQDRFRLIQARDQASDEGDQDGEGENARHRAAKKSSECLHKLY